MVTIVDRRLNPPGKHEGNRQKFLDRARGQVQDAVRRSVSERDLKDVGRDERVKVRSKDVSEPGLTKDPRTGTHRGVFPGNKQFQEGDREPKPPQGGATGGHDGPDSLDEFEFTLTRDEFLEFLFEDLELPDFVKRSMNVTDDWSHSRAGFTNDGSPANLSVVRTYKRSIGRRRALHRPTDEEVAELEALIPGEDDPEERARLEGLLEELQARQRVVPFIDDTDLRYNYYEDRPNPSTQAVMFCLMDVSGSMGEREKDIAKRFFLLLYLFLEKKYDRVDVRFVRHTTTAEEVDEKTFFYDRLTGGTRISSGLELIAKIVRDEYPVSDWNVYVAQCTDGDSFGDDNQECRKIIIDELQKRVQYYAYVQIESQFGSMYPFAAPNYIPPVSGAWPLFEQLAEEFDNVECRKVSDQNQVWSVFSSLFQRKRP